MKRKRKWRTVICAMTLFGISCVIAPTVMAEEMSDVIVENEESGISTRTVEREWLYTAIDGHLYKRLWNYTYGYWETDWIFVV